MVDERERGSLKVNDNSIKISDSEEFVLDVKGSGFNIDMVLSKNGKNVCNPSPTFENLVFLNSLLMRKVGSAMVDPKHPRRNDPINDLKKVIDGQDVSIDIKPGELPRLCNSNIGRHK